MTWLAGPLAGTFIQPAVGIIVDKYSRRKLIVATGLIGLSLSLLGLGWAPDLAGKRSGLAKGLVILFIFTLNFAVQPVQLGLRVLIIEHCYPEQQAMASAWAARMTGIGNILAQLIGSMDTTKLRAFMTASQFKNLCVLTAISLILTVLALMVFVKADRVPEDKFEKPNHQRNTLEGLRKMMRNLSPEVISVWKVQFFSWIGWFPFLYYATT